MNRKALCLAVAFLLSACANSTGNEAGNEGTDSSEVAMRPGKYEAELVREAMVPGQPSAPTHDVEYQCFSAEDLRHPEGIFVPTADGCRQQEAKASKGEFSASLVCNLPEYSPSDFVFDVHGTYDRESANLAGEANVASVTLRETRTFRRIGDC